MHFNARLASTAVDTLILHATVLDSIDEVEEHFCAPHSQVSAHYTIDRDGEIYQHVLESDCAWHVGESEHPDGRTALNEFSIGIELVNKNDGEDPYPIAQLTSLKELIRELCNRHPITGLFSHAEVARPVGRKDDPKGFDVHALRSELRL